MRKHRSARGCAAAVVKLLTPTEIPTTGHNNSERETKSTATTRTQHTPNMHYQHTTTPTHTQTHASPVLLPIGTLLEHLRDVDVLVEGFVLHRQLRYLLHEVVDLRDGGVLVVPKSGVPVRSVRMSACERFMRQSRTTGPQFTAERPSDLKQM
jgi:hypothetical protein